jgi:hypothetical protein
MFLMAPTDACFVYLMNCKMLTSSVLTFHVERYVQLLSARLLLPEAGQVVPPCDVQAFLVAPNLKRLPDLPAGLSNDKM